MSSTGKVTSGAPVGPSTPMMRLANARLASTSSSPVSSVSDSAGVGTSTDQPLPNDKQDWENMTFAALSEEEPVLPSYMSLDAGIPVAQETGMDTSVFLSVQEAARQVDTYERTIEVSEFAPKKSTKAFG